VPTKFDQRSWTRIASNVLRRTLGLRRGRNVIIDSWTPTLWIADIFTVEARRLGVRPLVFSTSPDAFLRSQREADAADANAISPAELAALAVCDGYIQLASGAANFTHREELPLANRRALDRRALEWNRALVRHSVPSVWLLGATVTESARNLAGVNPEAWRRENSRACSIDPRLIRDAARPLVRRLQLGRRITIVHPNGTRLGLGLLGRRPVVDDGLIDRQDLAEGRVWTTMPAGSLVVAVDERVAEGRFVSNRPSRHMRGSIRGLSWTFRKGRLVHHSVRTGRDLFERSFRRAGAERNHPSLLWIGLNPEIRDFPFAEDQERGVITVGIGHNDDFGGHAHGTYREYALIEGADLYIDDELLLRGTRGRGPGTSSRPR
jgi:leucyl aminopeptidase (aminopeptidase T)